MSEQPTRLVNCCCCGQSGERSEMYHDKIDGRFSCADLAACTRRQDEYVRTHRATPEYSKEYEDEAWRVFVESGASGLMDWDSFYAGYEAALQGLSNDERQPEDRVMPQER